MKADFASSGTDEFVSESGAGSASSRVLRYAVSSVSGVWKTSAAVSSAVVSSETVSSAVVSTVVSVVSAV